MYKKGLSTVVTTLIIILLVLVAIGIVWVVIANLITEGSEQIYLDKFTTDLKIKDVALDNATSGASMNIKRNVGKGDLEGIKFIFNDGKNSEVFEQENVQLEELGQKGFNFTISNLNIDDLQTVSIAPIYKSNSGENIYGGIIHTYKIKHGLLATCVDEPQATTCGSWVCGTRNNNCGNPVNCGSCGSGTHCDTGSCVPDTASCDLTSALWNPTAAVEGTTVSLDLQGTDCDGKTISFVVWEDDTLSGDDPVATNPVDITFSGSSGSGSWTAEWQSDASGDPEYYFIASVVSESETITSSAPDLTVAQAAQPCDLTTATWSVASVPDGTLVTLDLVGTNCGGEAITFDIYEDDPIVDDFVISLAGTYSSTSWTAHWTYAGDDDTGTDPRNYYFDATVDSNGDSVTSPTIEVTRIPGTCSVEGGEVCSSGYACSSSYLPASDTTECCPLGDCQLTNCNVCTDCEGFFGTCTYSECHSCLSGNCIYLGSVLGDDCVDQGSVCGSSITSCADYVQEECVADLCGVTSTTGCEWTGSACQDLPALPPTYAIRTFPSSTVPAGGDLNVMLELYVTEALERNATTGEGFVIAYENTSLLTAQGWITIDDGFGALGSSDDLGWEFSCTNPFCTIPSYQPLPYVLRAPATPGVYTFDGLYVAWGTTPTDGNPTLGDTQITVT